MVPPLQWLLKWRRHTLLMLVILAVAVSFCCLLVYKKETDNELRRSRRLPNGRPLLQPEMVVGPSSELSALHDSPKGGAEAFRVVHLDLKGAPPKLSYLKVLFPLLAMAGANALLIEYEDMFPYEKTIKNISALNAYTKAQVKEMLSLAKDNKLEVIPLIQTFGHLEFALKLPEFRYLRELESFPQEVCPSNPDSLRVLVYEMVDQLMELHPHTRFLHIGCDEVFHLAACGRCSRRRVGARALFTEHVRHVALHVRDTYSVTPLVWDDMFRQWSPTELAESGLGELVEPVVWVYIPDIATLVPHYVWHMYGATFPHVWVATAFKGAYGETNVLPDVARHLENHLAWVRFVRTKQPEPVRHFRGVVLTGWARYDHFAVLCELLPSAVPSLVLNLLVVTRATLGGASRSPNQLTTREEEAKLLEEVFEEWKNLLGCPQTFPKKSLKPFNRDPYIESAQTCSFPGSNLFACVLSFLGLKHDVVAFKRRLTETMGWMTRYNVRHNFSSPWRVVEGFSAVGVSGEQMSRHIGTFKNEVAGILTQYFDKYTVEEWLELNVAPLEEAIRYLETSARALMARNVWPRRPLL